MDRLLTASHRADPDGAGLRGADLGGAGPRGGTGLARRDARLGSARAAAFGRPDVSAPRGPAPAGPPAGATAGPPRRAGRHGAPPPPPAAPAPPAGRVLAGVRVPQPIPVRRIVMGVLVGALAMFGAATLDTFTGATVPVLGTLAALPAANDVPEVVEVPPPPATPGTCLMWTRPDAADTAVVDCSEPHLFEQAGSVTLTDQTTLPDDRQWRQLVNERCNPVVLEYLGGRFDPDGRYRIGALKPSPAKWAEGDRELRCGLQSASRSGALYPLAGRVAESDQSSVYEPSTCLAIDGRTIGDPVDCAGPHAVETVGIVDLAARFPDAFPAVGDQDAFLQPECGRIATEYAGSLEAITGKGLTVYWDNLTEESWNAGTRRVNCNLGALLPDRTGFAPVTGPVRGDVVVGDQPAPPATNTPEPGAPAATSTPGPPLDGPPAEAPPPSGTEEPQPSEPPADEGEATAQPTTTANPEPVAPAPPIGQPELPVPSGEA